MRLNPRFIPVLLVSATLILGAAIIVLSLHANRLRIDRETVLASAKYDGEILLSQLREMPAASIDFLEMDSGPDHPDLREANQAWTTWTQSFSTTAGFSEIIDWHRTRLEPLGWVAGEAENPDRITFTKGEWSLTLVSLSDTNPASFRRQIHWRVNL
ncbi:MAG: hypothetical protein ABL994_03095 [Verrucomicrobiales bacterium]